MTVGKGTSRAVTRGERDDIAFVQTLRGVAILLVVWAHVVGAWLDEHRREWVVSNAVRRYVATPAGIIQDFGFLGVVIFFLVSGFIITHVARRESRAEFALKRVLRIYPPFVFSVLFILAILTVRPAVGLARGAPSYSLGDVLRTMTLANYVMIPQHPVSGVAWTLFIEVAFYALCFVLLPLFARRFVIAIVLELAAVVIVVLNARSFAGSWFLFAVLVGYIPLLVLGQLIYYRWNGALGVRAFVLLSCCAYVSFVWGVGRINPTFVQPGNSYGVSVLFAYAIFGATMVFAATRSPGRMLAFCSRTSYSVYLVHGPLAYLVLDLLDGVVPFTVALVAALAVVAAAGRVMLQWIERPPQRLARQILDARATRRR